MVLEYQWLVPLFLVVSSILAVVANSLLLLVFFKRRGLRTISNRFVINLLITNLFSSVVLVPLLVINELKADRSNDIGNTTTTTEKTLILVETEDFIEIDFVRHRRNDFLCYFSQVATNLVCVSSIFGILLIGVDQYFAVVHPLRYHSYVNKTKSLVLLIGERVFSVLVALLDLAAFDFSNFWRFCKAEVVQIGRRPLEVAYAYVYFLVIVLLPFVTICSIYFKIYFAAHKSSERMRKSNSGSNQLIVKDGEDRPTSPLPRIHSAPNIREFGPVEKKISRSISDRANTNKIIVSLKSKISNASVFRYREETRAARISILVIFMVLICYFPYGTSIIVNSYRPEPNRPFNLISVALLVFSNIISPFLFAYRNKRIQREMIKVFLPKLLVKNGRKRKTEIPRVVITSNVEQGKESILKRVCSKTWSYKGCNFVSVPDSCLEARASFSSASTQISSAEE